MPVRLRGHPGAGVPEHVGDLLERHASRGQQTGAKCRSSWGCQRPRPACSVTVRSDRRRLAGSSRVPRPVGPEPPRCQAFRCSSGTPTRTTGEALCATHAAPCRPTIVRQSSTRGRPRRQGTNAGTPRCCAGSPAWAPPNTSGVKRTSMNGLMPAWDIAAERWELPLRPKSGCRCCRRPALPPAVLGKGSGTYLQRRAAGSHRLGLDAVGWTLRLAEDREGGTQLAGVADAAALVDDLELLAAVGEGLELPAGDDATGRLPSRPRGGPGLNRSSQWPASVGRCPSRADVDGPRGSPAGVTRATLRRQPQGSPTGWVRP